jgi:hypothetical protein
MAKNKISEFSATAADNTDITNINIAEGCSPANVNNSIRSLMALLKDQQTGTSGDNFSVGGNLAVTGTSTLTGNVTAPTQTLADNSTKVATTAFVTAAGTAALAADNTWTGTQTFKDNKFVVVDDSDATKKLNLQLSGITTATTRTLTVADKSGTIATTADLPALLNAAANTVVSGSYAVTASTTITITATNTYAVGQTVFIQFTNTSGSALTAGDFTIVTASGSDFTITYGSSVTSAGTFIATRYGIVALATSTDLSARTDTLRAVTSSNLVLTRGSSQASTSGTSITFTSIPSWVKRISIILSGVSTSGTSNKQIQLGTSGGFEVTSYLGGGSTLTDTLGTENNTTGFLIRSNAAADIVHGVITIVNITGNTWVGSGTYALSNAAETGISAGTKALGGALTQVRLTTANGTDTFDAGTINIMYE